MKYAIVKVTDGNYNIHTEHGSVTAAKVEFHNLCRNLWNDPGTTKAVVRIVDENLGMVDGYNEVITHAAPEASEE